MNVLRASFSAPGWPAPRQQAYAAYLSTPTSTALSQLQQKGNAQSSMMHQRKTSGPQVVLQPPISRGNTPFSSSRLYPHK